MQNYVLGVQPSELRYARVKIRPHPGELEYAKGTIPAQRGPIHVSWKDDTPAGPFSMKVTLPCNVRVDVYVPKGRADGTTVTVGGRPLRSNVRRRMSVRRFDGLDVSCVGLPVGFRGTEQAQCDDDCDHETLSFTTESSSKRDARSTGSFAVVTRPRRLYARRISRAAETRVSAGTIELERRLATKCARGYPGCRVWMRVPRPPDRAEPSLNARTMTTWRRS